MSIDLRPGLEECVEWATKAGISVRFFTARTSWQMFYCCTFESRLGNKIKTYEIKEASLSACLHHIEKHYAAIFSELSCPPWPRLNKLKT